MGTGGGGAGRGGAGQGSLHAAPLHELRDLGSAQPVDDGVSLVDERVGAEVLEVLELGWHEADGWGHGWGEGGGKKEDALRNYELFHQLKRGSATHTQVALSSAGIDGWAGWLVPDEGEEGAAEGEPEDRRRPLRV